MEYPIFCKHNSGQFTNNTLLFIHDRKQNFIVTKDGKFSGTIGPVSSCILKNISEGIWIEVSHIDAIRYLESFLESKEMDQLRTTLFPPNNTCKLCNGTGKITLLISDVSCECVLANTK